MQLVKYHEYLTNPVGPDDLGWLIQYEDAIMPAEEYPLWSYYRSG